MRWPRRPRDLGSGRHHRGGWALLLGLILGGCERCLCLDTARAPAEDTAADTAARDTGTGVTDTGGEDTDTGDWPWLEAPYVGDPRTCAWGSFLWDGAEEFLVQLRMPYTRNLGAAAESFSSSGSFPGSAELVVVANSSVREEATLSEYCDFDTDDPTSYSVPGTWWFADAGAAEVEAEYLGPGDAPGAGDCDPDQHYRFSLALSAVTVSSDSADSYALADQAWEGLEVTYPGCPPE